MVDAAPEVIARLVASGLTIAVAESLTGGQLIASANSNITSFKSGSITGTNGSAGPLGAPSSDENVVGDQLVTTFEHGKIAYNSTTGQVEVTVNGKVVPSGL